jgi:hypothetical protein
VATTSNGNSYRCTTTSVTFDVTPPGMTEITNVFMDGILRCGRLRPDPGVTDQQCRRQAQLSEPTADPSFNALDDDAGEGRAAPRLIAYDQHLFAMCETWIEVYRNVGIPEVPVCSCGGDQPRSHRSIGRRRRTPGTALAALVRVGDDNGIHILDGYTATRISTPDVDRDIEELADKSTIEAQAYITSGAAFVTVSSSEWTWEFNLTTQQWNERRSRLKSGALLDRWRGTGDTVFAFGKWLIGDTHSGKLHEITADARMDDDAPLVMRIESAPTRQHGLWCRAWILTSHLGRDGLPALIRSRQIRKLECPGRTTAGCIGEIRFGGVSGGRIPIRLSPSYALAARRHRDGAGG